MSASLREVGPYRIEGELGRGAMGIVYAAVHSTLGRKVALKSLPAELTREAAFRERFASEARTQALLQHPSIVSVFDFVKQDGVFHLVMERFSSRSLEAHLQDRSGVGLGETAALAILRQLLAALDHAHSQGVIHRDVKPGNVLLGDGGVVKLTDFGIALLIGDRRLTQDAHTIGTPLYMSPEQILRPREIDHRTDLYSTAVLAFELLTGHPPFDHENDYELKRLHLETPVETLADRLSTVSPHVAQSILKALSKQPADRFASAGAFLRAIEGTPPTDDKPVRKVRPTRSMAPLPQRNRLRRTIGIGLVFLVLGASAYQLWRRMPANESAMVEPAPRPPTAAPPTNESPPPSETPPPVEIPPSPPAVRPEPARERASPPLLPPAPVPEPDPEARLEELRERHRVGVAEARILLSQQDIAGARERTRQVRGDIRSESARLEPELSELDQLDEEITKQEVLVLQKLERERLGRAAWDERVLAVETFLAKKQFSEARSEASRLLKASDLPAELIPRVTELMEEADRKVRDAWRGIQIESHSRQLNPRQKKPKSEDPPPPSTRGAP